MRYILLCAVLFTASTSALSQDFNNSLQRNLLMIGVDNVVRVPVNHPRNCTAEIVNAPQFFDVKEGSSPGEWIIHPHRTIAVYDTIFQPWYWKELSGEPCEIIDGQKAWKGVAYDEDPLSDNYGLPIGEKQIVKTTDNPIVSIDKREIYILSDFIMEYNPPFLAIQDGKEIKQYAFELVEFEAEVSPELGFYGNGSSIPVDELKLRSIRTKCKWDKSLLYSFSENQLKGIADTMLFADVISYELIILPEGGVPISSMQLGSHIPESSVKRIQEMSPCRVVFNEIKALCWDGTVRDIGTFTLNIQENFAYTASSAHVNVNQVDVVGYLPGFPESKQKQLFQFVTLPMEVSFEGSRCENFKLTSQEATIESTEQPHVFLIKPIKLGDCVISVEGVVGNQRFLDSLRYMVMNVPIRPQFGVLNPTTPSATRMEFNAPAMTAWLEDGWVLPCQAEIAEYAIHVNRRQGQLDLYNYGASLSEEARMALSQLSVGDVVTFDHIRCTLNEHMLSEYLPSFSVSVK